MLLCLCRCCGLERAPAAVDAAIVAICYLGASPKLQHMLLESGALAVLVPLLLQYDVTLSPEASTRLQLPFTTSSTSATAAAADGVQQQGPEASGLRLLDMALVRPNMQEARSQHALLAAQALARLAGEPRTLFWTCALAASSVQVVVASTLRLACWKAPVAAVQVWMFSFGASCIVVLCVLVALQACCASPSIRQPTNQRRLCCQPC